MATACSPEAVEFESRVCVPVTGRARADARERAYRRELLAVVDEGHALLDRNQGAAEEEWEDAFGAYGDRLRDARRQGEELRPSTLRDREEELSGEGLVVELAELFAL